MPKATIQNAARLRQKLDKLPDKAKQHIKTELEKKTKSIAKLARKNVREKTKRRTGTLRRSIEVRKVDELTYEVGVFNQLAFYASFIELGTKKMPRRPFLRPAYRQRRNATIAGLKRAIKKGIKEIT